MLGVEKKVENPDFEVDAVTGATLTSNGVRDMLRDKKTGIGAYVELLKNK